MSTPKTADDLYSHEARTEVLENARNQAVSMAGFQAQLQDIGMLQVSSFLKERARAVINAALKFDKEHAGIRLAEAAAFPEREIPDPYSDDNQEALRAVVREVVVTVVDVINPYMPLGWGPIPEVGVEGSRFRAQHRDLALIALDKAIDQEYPRLRLDFQFQVQASRNPAARTVVHVVTEATQAPQQRRRPRRRRPDGSPENTADLLVSGLLAHHKYFTDDGLVSDPVSVGEFAQQMKVGKASVSRFFKQRFGSHKQYQQVCRRGDIARHLAKLAGDGPMRGIPRDALLSV